MTEIGQLNADNKKKRIFIYFFLFDSYFFLETGRSSKVNKGEKVCPLDQNLQKQWYGQWYFSK